VRLHWLRHGPADRKEWIGSDDRKRPLTSKGRERIERETLQLAEMDFLPSLILTSPLTRARQTAEIVARVLGRSGDLREEPLLAPGFSLTHLTELLTRYDDRDDLLLVGHEPDFSETLSAVIGGGQLLMKKGGLACVDLAQLDPPSGVLLWLVPPKFLVGD
jgi:phosphohistidine phosphatase